MFEFLNNLPPMALAVLFIISFVLFFLWLLLPYFIYKTKINSDQMVIQLTAIKKLLQQQIDSSVKQDAQ